MWRVIKRAFKDTRDFIGWNKKSLAFPVLWIGGAVFYWWWQGAEAVTEEFRVSVAFGFIPVVGFALVLFLFHLIRAPVYIAWERDKIANVIVKPRSGKRQWDFENPHLM